MNRPEAIRRAPAHGVSLGALRGTNETGALRLLDAFASVYHAAFPDESEREDPANWWPRIVGASATHEPWMDIIVIPDPPGTGVLGGVAFEYYPASHCGLLTYLAVASGSRGQGLSRALVRSALDGLRDAATQQGHVLAAVFAEAEWPDRMQRSDAAAVATARRRMAVLASLGARMLLELPYVQPELPGGRGRARHLALMAMAEAGNSSADAIDRGVVESFLREFYACLGIDSPGDDPDFRAMVDQLPGSLALLRPEAPVFATPDAVACLHAVSELPEALRGLCPVTDPCPVFGSMERDLLSYSYQEQPAFSSHCLAWSPGGDPRGKCLDIEVEFPSLTRYRSEGRLERRICVATRRRLSGHLSCTIFHDAGMVVWHLALRPAAAEWFDEYDLIRLVHLYDGVTEQTGLHEQLRFHCGDARNLAVDELFALAITRLSGEQVAVGRPLAGTVQLIDAPPHPLGALDALHAMHDEPEGLAENSRAQARLRALCGLVTGIFDFDEIDTAEAADTLEATVELDDALLRIHRRTLVHVARRDRALEAVRHSVGVSPYLLVPHAVLVFNEALLREANDEADRVSAAPRPSLRALSRARELIDGHLNVLWLPNVFNYDTERQIHERGLEGRGDNDRLRSVQRKLADIESWIERSWQVRRDRGEMIIAVMLMWISLVQIKEPVTALVARLAGERMFEPATSWSAFAAIGLALTLAISAAWRSGVPSMRNVRSRAGRRQGGKERRRTGS